MTAEAERAREVLVWDILVRIGHWLLVVFFFIAFLTEEDLLTLHTWAGYAVGIYVIVRIVWGLVGSKHARFSDFAFGPAEAARYLKNLLHFRAKRYLGHSPAGAVMVYALLISLAATTATGIAVLAVERNTGPLAPWLGRGASITQTVPVLSSSDASESEAERGESDGGAGDLLKGIHEFLSSLTMLLIILHLAGVALASVVHRENLVRAMVNGRKRAE